MNNKIAVSSHLSKKQVQLSGFYPLLLLMSFLSICYMLNLIYRFLKNFWLNLTLKTIFLP